VYSSHTCKKNDWWISCSGVKIHSRMYKHMSVPSTEVIVLNTFVKTKDWAQHLIPSTYHTLPQSSSIPFLSILFAHAQQTAVSPTDILLTLHSTNYLRSTLKYSEVKHGPHDCKKNVVRSVTMWGKKRDGSNLKHPIIFFVEINKTKPNLPSSDNKIRNNRRF
jgi:hypothetical protein